MAQPLPPLSAGAVLAIADGTPDIKAVVQIIGALLRLMEVKSGCLVDVLFHS